LLTATDAKTVRTSNSMNPISNCSSWQVRNILTSHSRSAGNASILLAQDELVAYLALFPLGEHAAFHE
jgi:hypothetical protein